MMRKHPYSERRACKLLSMDRTTYRYQPRPDHNAELREKLIALARQKPRYGYRRLHALLERDGSKASSATRVSDLQRRSILAVRRLKRKRLVRLTPGDSVADLLHTGRNGLLTLWLTDWPLDAACAC